MGNTGWLSQLNGDERVRSEIFLLNGDFGAKKNISSGSEYFDSAKYQSP